jgi:hypothetical protein
MNCRFHEYDLFDSYCFGFMTTAMDIMGETEHTVCYWRLGNGWECDILGSSRSKPVYCLSQQKVLPWLVIKLPLVSIRQLISKVYSVDQWVSTVDITPLLHLLGRTGVLRY